MIRKTVGLLEKAVKEIDQIEVLAVMDRALLNGAIAYITTAICEL
jgi:GTP1/Obg family GTP-binding protein